MQKGQVTPQRRSSIPKKLLQPLHHDKNHESPVAAASPGAAPAGSSSPGAAVTVLASGAEHSQHAVSPPLRLSNPLDSEYKAHPGRVSKFHSPVQNQKKTKDMIASSAAETLLRFLSSIREINFQHDFHSATASITQATVNILGCERCVLYFADYESNELVEAVTSADAVAAAAMPTRVAFGAGIAGQVAQTGETLNVEDASTDPRFKSLSDSKSKKSVLAVSVTDYDGQILAVLEAINKTCADSSSSSVPAASYILPFTVEDAILAENIALHIGVVLRNIQLYNHALRNERKVNSLLDIVKSLHSDPAMQSVIFTLTHRAHTLCDADLCTLFMADHAHEQLVVMQGELNIRIPMSKGIAGFVATSGAVLNIPDAYADSRFNRDVDAKTGYRTKAILCMPIFNPQGDKEVIAVLQLINKLDGGRFTAEDEEIMTTLLRIVGPIMAQSKLFMSKKPETEAPTDLDHSTVSRSSTHSSTMASILEDPNDDTADALSPKAEDATSPSASDVPHSV